MELQRPSLRWAQRESGIAGASEVADIKEGSRSMTPSVRSPWKCSLHVTLEHLDIVAVELCGFLVERIVWIGLIEQVDQAIYYGVDVEHRLPVLAQDVKADIAFKVDVRVKDPRLAVHLGRFVRVHRGDCEGESVGCALPEARIWRDDDVELGKVVSIRKANRCHL